MREGKTPKKIIPSDREKLEGSRCYVDGLAVPYGVVGAVLGLDFRANKIQIPRYFIGPYKDVQDYEDEV